MSLERWVFLVRYKICMRFFLLYPEMHHTKTLRNRPREYPQLPMRFTFLVVKLKIILVLEDCCGGYCVVLRS